MPGLTNNTNLLSAANQIIVALNEIASKILDPEDQAGYLSAIGTGLTTLDTTVGNRLSATNTHLGNIYDEMASCCAGMQAQLQGIISAIQNIRFPTSTPGDSGGPYLDEEEIDTTSEDYEPPPDPYKCRAANYTFDYMWKTLGMIAGASNMTMAVSTGAATVLFGSILAFLSFTAPPAAIIAALIVTLTELLIGTRWWMIYTYFEDMQNEFEDNRQELVCQLYQAALAGSQEQAKAAINNFVDDVIDGVVTIDHGLNLTTPQQQLLDTAIRAVVNRLAGNFAINKMFTINAEVDVYNGEMYDMNPMIDCADCDDEEDTGVYDFEVSDYNWVLKTSLCIVEANAAYAVGTGFSCSNPSNSSETRVVIQQTVPHTVDNLRFTFTSIGFIGATVLISVADEYDGEYSEVGRIENMQPGTYEKTNLGIVEKYLRVYLLQFQNQPWAIIKKIEYYT